MAAGEKELILEAAGVRGQQNPMYCKTDGLDKVPRMSLQCCSTPPETCPSSQDALAAVEVRVLDWTPNHSHRG